MMVPRCITSYVCFRWRISWRACSQSLSGWRRSGHLAHGLAVSMLASEGSAPKNGFRRASPSLFFHVSSAILGFSDSPLTWSLWYFHISLSLSWIDPHMAYNLICLDLHMSTLSGNLWFYVKPFLAFFVDLELFVLPNAKTY